MTLRNSAEVTILVFFQNTSMHLENPGVTCFSERKI